MLASGSAEKMACLSSGARDMNGLVDGTGEGGA